MHTKFYTKTPSGSEEKKQKYFLCKEVCVLYPQMQKKG